MSHADATKTKKAEAAVLFFTLDSFDKFVDMKPDFQSLFSSLNIFYPSMLTKPKGKQIAAGNLNKTFHSGRSIIKNLPQRMQSIAKISSRFFCSLFITSMDNMQTTTSNI